MPDPQGAGTRTRRSPSRRSMACTARWGAASQARAAAATAASSPCIVASCCWHDSLKACPHRSLS